MSEYQKETMIIRKAENRDREQLDQLWLQCFHDDEAYRNLFFHKRFSPEHTAVMEINGEVAGMGHFLPCRIKPHENALYWYAFGVAEKHRKKGLFRKFCTILLNECQKNGFSSIVKPAAGLEGFYRSIGFDADYTIHREKYFRSEENGRLQLVVEKAEPADFLKLSLTEGSTLWTKKDIEYAFIENEQCGGEEIRIQFDDQEYLMFLSATSENWVIRYHNLDKKNAPILINAILDKIMQDLIEVEWTGGDFVNGLSDSKHVRKDSAIYFHLG